MSVEIIEVNEDDDGQRLDRWLKKQRPDLPYVLVQKLLRKGQVRVDGKRAQPDTRLEEGQKVRMPIGSTEKDGDVRKKKVQQSMSIKDMAVFEDEDLIILNKPSGLAVQGGSGLKIHLEMMLGPFSQRGVLPRLVHRLDRETSGLLILARSAAITRVMTTKFAERQIHKTYLALVSPVPPEKKGRIDLKLRKVSVGKGIETMQVSAGGQEAQTDYEVLATNPNGVALVQFSPHTGRTHQIRVHASASGFPLLGDEKYGGDMEILKSAKVPVRVQLHAARLKFEHPHHGDKMDIKAPLPNDLRASFTAFGFPLS
jgi:23S rRNA pseudouridine955/2504/2580 synthase